MPQFEETMYIVPENDRTIPLCIDIGVGITEPIEYVIRAVQKSPPEAEGNRDGSVCYCLLYIFGSSGIA